MDQMQYTEWIKLLVEFLGFRLSLEELSGIWALQRGSTMDNIHSVLIGAAAKFSDKQITHLFSLIHKVS